MTANLHRLLWSVAVCTFVISETLLIWSERAHPLHNIWPFPFLAVPIAALTPLAVSIDLNSRLGKRLKESHGQLVDGIRETTSSYLASMTIMGYLMLIGGVLAGV